MIDRPNPEMMSVTTVWRDGQRVIEDSLQWRSIAPDGEERYFAEDDYAGAVRWAIGATS